jgi:hypothetical protein
MHVRNGFAPPHLHCSAAHNDYVSSASCGFSWTFAFFYEAMEEPDRDSALGSMLVEPGSNSIISMFSRRSLSFFYLLIFIL